MTPVYEALFDTYGCSVLREADNYGEAAITALPEQCAPDRKARLELEDTFFGHGLRRSADAFALGLHPGLSLLHDQVRRVRSQQVQ